MGNWMIVPSDSDMVHHGVKDQKWGVRNGPPYPLQMTRKAYKAAQKGVTAVAKGTITVAKAAKKHHEESKVKKQNKKDAKERKKTEKMKKEAISLNSYQKLYEMKDRLSYSELQDAKNRIRLEQEIYSLGNPPKKGFKSYMNDLFSTVRDVNNWYTNGRNAWNNFAELYNSSDAGMKKPLRVIGGKNNQNNSSNDNKKDDDEKKKK